MENKLLYDADSNQRVKLATVIGGEVYELDFEFRPLGDDQAISFIDNPELDSAILFTTQLVGVTGTADDPQEDDAVTHLESLAALVPDEDKRFAIDGSLFGTRMLPAPKAKKKLNLRALPETAKYQMAVYFDGQEVLTTHEMIPGTAQHAKVFNALQLRQFPVKFGDYELKSYGAGLVKLYDAVFCSALGYAGNKVPAIHKMVIIAEHLRGQRQIVMGK